MATCGSCNATGVDVAHVKKCYKIIPDGLTPAAAEKQESEPATEKQVNFLGKLASERGLPVPVVRNKRDASAEISRLLALPKTQQAFIGAGPALREAPSVNDWAAVADGLRPIPASKYAVEIDGQLCFFSIEEGRGNHKGRKFLNGLVGAPGSWRKTRLSPSRSLEVIRLIDFNPKEAAIRYSREFVRCAVCESPLSDPDSRERGLGPICAGRF